ncbi:MAG: nicotinate-nucleotide adenylyltransferase [Luteimonas sp.]
MTLQLFYGGTFDPVHFGHLAIARAAHAALHCSVRLMPTADPPHRAPPGADAAQRAAMLDLAIAGEHGLCVDRRELDRGGRSYTIDTLHALRAELGATAPLALLVGADSFLGLPSWKHWRQLFELTHFVVAERPGSPIDHALPTALADAAAGRWSDHVDALAATPAGALLRLQQPLHAVSASDVRRRIADDRDWRSLLTAPVADYIAANRLYRKQPGHPERL